MTSFTSTGWAAGETVTAYAVSRTPPGASGASAGLGVASASGVVEFSGLAEETDFRATGGTSARSVRFHTGVPETAQSGSAAEAAAPAMPPDLQARLPLADVPENVGSIYARYRADDLVGADGSAVSSWTDISGNGRHLVQATGGAQPTLKRNQLNGRAAVRFTPGKFMVNVGALALPYTITFVARIPTASGSYRFVVNNGDGDGIFCPPDGGMNFAFNGDASVIDSAVPMGDGVTAVFTMEFTAGRYRLWRNGIPISSRSTAGRALTAIVVSTNDDGEQAFTNFDGDVYEIVVQSGILRDNRRRGGEQALCAYYGLQWSTAAGPATRISGTLSTGDPFEIWTPQNFSRSRPTPLLLFSHGASQLSTSVIFNDQMARITDAALQMGFVVASCLEHDGGANNWAGATAAIADGQALYDYVAANVTPEISRTVVAAISYGGITSLLNVSRKPNVVGWLGIEPVCDSSLMPRSLSAVANPMTENTALYANKRFCAFASSGDTVVTKANHSTAFLARIAGVAREATMIDCVGNHGDVSHFQPVEVAEFLMRCLSD